MRRLGAVLVLLVGASGLRAQALKPGFDKAEYLELLRLHVRLANPDSLFWAGIPRPRQFKLAYRSPVVVLDNRCGPRSVPSRRSLSAFGAPPRRRKAGWRTSTRPCCPLPASCNYHPRTRLPIGWPPIRRRPCMRAGS